MHPNRLPPPYTEQLTIVLFGKKVQLKNIIGNMILNHPAFNTTCNNFVFGENNSFKIINTPEFFDEDTLYPDQMIIDFMAIFHPGPHLFILAIDSENTQEEKIMAQIKKLQDSFGETITEHLVILLPDIESFVSLAHLREQFNIQMATNEKLGSDCRKWCSGRQSFLFDYKNYSQDVVMRRKTEIATRYNNRPMSFRRRADANTLYPSTSQHAFAAPAIEPHEHHTGSRTYRESNDIFNIVLLGVTGTGKSACANTILAAGNQGFSQPFPSVSSSMPVTTKCEVRVIRNLYGTEVRVVDTPDFLQNDLENSQAQLEVCKSFCQRGQCVVLLVLQLGRVTEAEQGIVDKLEKKLGWMIRESTIVLLTHGEDLKGSLEHFIKKCVPLKNIIDMCNRRYHLFSNSSKDVKQVRELIRKIPDLERRLLKNKKKDCFVS